MGLVVGLVVGLPLGFSLLFFVVIPVCIGCAVKRLRRSTVRTHAVATGTTVVTANLASATSAPTAQPQFQQQVYKDAQFSSQEAPPSYTAATALPTYAGPYPQV